MVADCVFCDKSKFEERLVGETKDSWIIATLGQISNGGDLLLVPKKHIACVGAMEKKSIELLTNSARTIYLALNAEYQCVRPLVFEHGIVGQTIEHAHLHFIPETCNITKRVRVDFPQNEIMAIENLDALRALYSKIKEPYLFWLDSDKARICWNPPAPPQYLRLVIAEALGRHERGNWRNMDHALDKKLWTETVIRLKPYFS